MKGSMNMRGFILFLVSSASFSVGLNLRQTQRDPYRLLATNADVSESLIILERQQRSLQLVEDETYNTLDAEFLSVNNQDEFAWFLFLSTCSLCFVLVTADTATAAPLVDDGSILVGTTTTAAAVWQPIFAKATQRAISGGRAGATAAVVQVISLMWLRTCMNYQYRYGGTLSSALASLWEAGGIPRLYQGLPFALLQGPLTRFGDTAANVGVLVILDSVDLPLPLKTACGSVAAGLWRIVLMPVDASKTSLQVQGPGALQRLWADAPASLYRGAWAQAAATAVGHFPWFLTYNVLDEKLPRVESAFGTLLRSAALGFAASCVSDCSSNSLRVIKTTKQTAQLGTDYEDSKEELSYPQIVKMIVEKDGLAGLFGRGLQTRLLTNAIQGAIFSVLWRYFQQMNSS